MDEREKIAYAKSFIDKMAEGINPLTGEQIPDGELLNNVRISRCLFYVSEILGKAISYEETPQKKAVKSKIKRYVWKDEFAELFRFSNEPVYMKYIVGNFDELNAEEGIKFPRVALSRWLFAGNYIEEIEKNGKNYKFPTQKGLDNGFLSVYRDDYGSGYYALMYSLAAQKLIVGSAAEILGEYYGEKDRVAEEKAEAKAIAKKSDPAGERKTFENQGLPWSRADDDKLREMFSDGLTVGEMMKELKRSRGGIKARLGVLGLIDSLGGAL